MILPDSVGAASFVLYLLSLFHFLLFLLMGRDRVARVGLYAARIGFLFNLIYLFMLIANNGSDVLFSPKGALSALSLAFVSVFLFFVSKFRLGVLGAFFMPWICLFSLASLLLGAYEKLYVPVGILGGFHVAAALLGYAFFALSAVVSVIYLIFEYQLKEKKFNVFYQKIPSLFLLESIIYKSMAAGFVLITLAMFAGAIWSEKLYGTYWMWHPKQTATLIAWFVYAAILHLYLGGNWKGRKLCYLSLFGFLVIVVDFAGVNLLTKDIHAFK